MSMKFVDTIPSTNCAGWRCERCDTEYASPTTPVCTVCPAPPDAACNRSACRAPGARWFNKSTRAWYCRPCALAINEHAPGLCVEVAAAQAA